MNNAALNLESTTEHEFQVLWPETYHLRPIQNLAPLYKGISVDTSLETNPAYIKKYPQAEIYFNAAECAVWGADGNLCWQYGLNPTQLQDKYEEPSRQLGNVLLLGDSPGAHCYYHWIVDILPKIELLRRNGIKIDEFDAILVRELNDSFQKETLETLGVDLSTIVETKDSPKLSCTSLTTVEIDNCINMKMHRFIPEWLKHSFSTRPDLAPERKIYVSRPKGVRRGVENEEELLPVLTDHGFEIHKMEGLSVAEQAELFSQSRVVVSAHGGALTNMVYMPSGGHVVELFGGHVYPFYYGLSQVCDLGYSALMEDIADLPRLTSLNKALIAGNVEQQLKTRFLNFSVSVDALAVELGNL